MYTTLLPKFTALVILCLFAIHIKANPNTIKHNSKTEIDNEVCDIIPTISCPPFVWIKPTEISDPSRTGEPVVDPGGLTCNDPIVTFRDEVEIINLCHIITTRTWFAINPDNPALFSSCTQTIKQVDEEAPVISNVPEDITIFANRSNCRSMVFWEEPSIFENVLLDDIVVTGVNNGQQFIANNGGLFDQGVNTITYTATDICTNFATASFTITVICADCHIVCPPDVCSPIGSDVSIAALGSATGYSGNVDCGTVDIQSTDIMMQTGCRGAMLFSRVWTGEFSEMPNTQFSCTQRIELKDDTEITLTNCPEDIVVDNNFTAVFWDDPRFSNGSNTITIVNSIAQGSFFPVGLTTVVVTATDECGNEAICTFKVSVLEDITATDCPDDLFFTCDGDGGTIVNFDPPEYTGNCNICPQGRSIPGFLYMGSMNGSQYYCSRSNYNIQQAREAANRLGGHIVTINSEEENEFIASNIISRTALIGLTDIAKEGDFVWDSGQDLVYTNWFANQPNDKGGIQDIVEIDRAGLWNDADNDLKLEFVLEIPCEFVTQITWPLSGTFVNAGTHTVLFRIADGCGLEEFCSFDIVVEEGLTLECIDDKVVRIPASENSRDIYYTLPDANSCCSNCNNPSTCAEVFVVSGPLSGSTFLNNSTTTITYRATDLCGRSTDCSFNITVEPRDGNRFTELEIEGIDRDNPDEDENQITEYKVYPNPVKDELNVILNDHESIYRMSIMTPDGKTLINTKNIEAQNKISMTELNSGLQLLVLEYKDGRVKYEKIIKI
jgi:hypothetical protein